MVSAVAGNGVVDMSWRSLLSERTLLLNVTFQPLSIISVRRAVLLVLAEKAEMLNCSDEVLRSESLEIQVPLVVRLNSYVRAPFGTGHHCTEKRFSLGTSIYVSTVVRERIVSTMFFR